MPPHEVYIEPFLGSGAILRMKRPALVNIGIDRDAEAIAQWRYPLAGHDDIPQDPIADYADVSAGIATTDDTADGTLHKHTPPVFTVIHGDAFAFLSSYNFKGSELVYCDPPTYQKREAEPITTPTS